MSSHIHLVGQKYISKSPHDLVSSFTRFCFCQNSYRHKVVGLLKFGGWFLFIAQMTEWRTNDCAFGDYSTVWEILWLAPTSRRHPWNIASKKRCCVGITWYYLRIPTFPHSHIPILSLESPFAVFKQLMTALPRP
jgi:hypothetical protein